MLETIKILARALNEGVSCRADIGNDGKYYLINNGDHAMFQSHVQKHYPQKPLRHYGDFENSIELPY